jgi:hypothetical protein
MVFSQQKGQGELTQTNGILGLDKWSNRPRSCIRHQHDDHLRNWYWHILTADIGHKWYKWWSFVPLDPVTCCVAKRPIFMRYHALILRHPPRVQRIWCMEEIMWPVSRELDTCWWFLR